ncbi:unnamed protein product, partial [Prunus brigantina]
PPVRFPPPSATADRISPHHHHLRPSRSTAPVPFEPPPSPLSSPASAAPETAAASPESAENGPDFQKIQTSRSPSFLNQIGRVRYSDHAYSAGSLGLSPVATELRSRADRVLPNS